MASLSKVDESYANLGAPAALVFGNDEHRRNRIARLLAERGLRVVASDTIEASDERLKSQARAGALVVDVVDDSGTALDTLLSRVTRAAANRTVSTLVTMAPGMIDVVAGRMLATETQLLVDPDDTALDDAIAFTLAETSPSVADSSGERGSRRLAELSEEVGRIARALASLSGGETSATPAVAPSPTRDTAADLALIRAIIRTRRLRDQFFDAALFADPAWDMLLDLTAASFERRTVAVSSLCIAASVPATTALRWIATMSAQGLLVRSPDPDDGRRVFIALSTQAMAGMASYLAAAGRVMTVAG